MRLLETWKYAIDYSIFLSINGQDNPKQMCKWKPLIIPLGLISICFIRDLVSTLSKITDSRLDSSTLLDPEARRG